MKKIKKIAKNILFTFIFPFFFLFIFVFKIRIGYLPTDKIGDFSDVSNNFYLEIKENKINKFKFKPLNSSLLVCINEEMKPGFEYT